MAEWTDELKASVIAKYETATPTAETSTEIVKNIAEALGDGFTVNGVRVILVKAGVYIKKGTTPAATTTADGTATKATRVNKADAMKALTDLIEGAGLEVDMDIISKLTGKAAVYFTEVIEKTIETEEEVLEED